MPLDIDRKTAPARAAGCRASALAALVLVLAVSAPARVAHAWTLQPATGTAQAHGGAGSASEPAHEQGVLPTVAKLFNFAVLVGVLAYFLRAPLASYLSSRATQIRHDLVTAAEMRAAATAQLADVERQIAALPAEIDALRARGAEDVIAERGRIELAAAAERERMLAHTRREIETQLRVARRGLIEYAAQLAVDVAEARITRTITDDDQLRIVDRYAAQLGDAR